MIRYDQAYNQKISRVVSNFNRKVRRLEKEEAELLPSTVSVREIKAQFTNRRDLNTYLRDLQRFGKRGSEEIVTIKGKKYTKYQIDVFKHRLARERRAIAAEIKAESGRKSKYPMQHNISLQNLINRQERLTGYWYNILDSKLSESIGNYQRKLETYDNLFDIMFQDAYLVDFEESKIQHIKAKLLELSPNKLMKALENRPEIQAIFEYYHALTRRSSEPGKVGYDQFQVLYESIDEIVETYK